jgi:hypothetical protein
LVRKRFICFKLSVLLTLLSFFNCFLFREEYGEKLLVEGKIGTGEGELSWKMIDLLPTGPISFGINKRGEVFVLDLLCNRVANFDREGKFVENFPQSIDVYLMDIAFDKKNNLYLEYWSGDIAIYDKDMNFKRKLDLEGKGHPITPMEVTYHNTILLVDPNTAHGDKVIEVDTNGNVITSRDNLPGYIITKGEYYLGSDNIVYNPDGKKLFSLKKLKIENGHPEIIGIDSLRNIYFKTEVENALEDHIIKVSPKGRKRADFFVKYSSGHSEVCRTIRVSDAGLVYVLDEVNEKFQLWEYYPQ